MLTILIMLIILALLFGGFGHSRSYGYAGWSPLGLLLVVLLVLYLIGGL